MVVGGGGVGGVGVVGVGVGVAIAVAAAAVLLSQVGKELCGKCEMCSHATTLDPQD